MKGMTANLIWVMIGLFFFAILWMMLNEVYTQTHSYATGAITETGSVTTLAYMDMVWNYWPLVMLVGGYLMYMFSRSQKKGLT